MPLLMYRSFSWIAKTDLMCPMNKCWRKYFRMMVYIPVLFCVMLSKLHIFVKEVWVLFWGVFSLFPSLFNLFYCSVTFSKTCCNLAGTVGNHKGDQKKDLTPIEPKVSLKVFSNTPDPCLPHISYLQYRGSSIHCL